MSNFSLDGGWNNYVAREGNRCPINPDLYIEYQIDHGNVFFAFAKDAPWSFRHGIGPSIVGFRVVKREPQADASGCVPLDGVECAHSTTIKEQSEQLKKWLTLTDPAVLFQNLLNGVPARLSQEQLLHLAGVAQRKTGDGWIPWDGGECPVDFGAVVSIQLGDGEFIRNSIASMWDWGREFGVTELNIIAYKIVESEE